MGRDWLAPGGRHRRRIARALRHEAHEQPRRLDVAGGEHCPTLLSFASPAELVFRHRFAGRRLDNSRTREKHRGFSPHDNNVGQARRAAGAAGTRTGDTEICGTTPESATCSWTISGVAIE